MTEATVLAPSEAFARQTVPFRRELLAHCYQMLGSVHDAEDLVQETMLRAWRAYDRFDGQRASMRTWLHRIATNACLNALDSRKRRPLPSGLGAPNEDPLAPMALDREMPWLEPIPDALLGARTAAATDIDPAAVVLARGRLRLAVIAAMQHLPARQRAILILRDVLEWPASDVAKSLDTTVVAVNSALQRARAKLAELGVGEDQIGEPDQAEQRALVDRYVQAFVAADLTTLAGLLAEDVVLEMPPVLNWYTGREHYVRFIARSFEIRGTDWRMVPAAANGQPAVAAYVRAEKSKAGGDSATGDYELHSVQLFSVGKSGVTRLTVYVDPSAFEAFDLPARLPAADLA
ncbi:MAG: sigma-70 family RNA polymerase sigma factor [Actinocrinis sp.]